MDAKNKVTCLTNDSLPQNTTDPLASIRVLLHDIKKSAKGLKGKNFFEFSWKYWEMLDLMIAFLGWKLILRL